MSTPSPAVHGYHAHVYYDTDTSATALKLHDTLAANFPVEVGALRDEYRSGRTRSRNSPSSSRPSSSRPSFRG